METEARQRDAQVEEDRREKIEAGKFKQQDLDLKREELELRMALFELERKEREARIESEKNEKWVVYEMMRTEQLSPYFITPLYTLTIMPGKYNK